jgi:hypothetical protein
MRGGSSLLMSECFRALSLDLCIRRNRIVNLANMYGLVLHALNCWLSRILLIRQRVIKILQSGCPLVWLTNANTFVLGCRSSPTTA